MANISTARGDICITANSKEAVKAIFSGMIDSENNAEYYYGLVTAETPDSLYITQDENGKYNAWFGFDGEGRWSLESTLDHYAKRAADVLGRRDRDLLNAIEQEEFKIDFGYIDYEPGLQFILQQKGVLNHPAGTPLEKSEFAVYETYDVEYNFNNLLEATQMTEDELIKYVGGQEEAKKLGYAPEPAAPAKRYSFYAENYSSNLPIYDPEGYELDWETFQEKLKEKIDRYKSLREWVEIACIPVADSYFADIYLDEFEEKICLDIRSVDGSATFDEKIYPGMDYEAELLNWSTSISNHNVDLNEFPKDMDGFVQKLGEALDIACKKARLGSAGIKEAAPTALPIEIAIQNAIKEILNKEEYKESLSKISEKALIGACKKAIQTKVGAKEAGPQKVTR